MGLRNYDNTNSSGISSIVNRRAAGTPATQAISETRVLVLGFFKSRKDDDGNDLIPVQEVYPSTPGSISISSLISETMNFTEAEYDGQGELTKSAVNYPSELSIALEECALGGVTNVQVLRLGDSARYTDVSGRMARERYIALENAYQIIADSQFDVLYPANVVAGKNGDGLYNTQEIGKEAEVYFDPDAITLGSEEIPAVPARASDVFGGLDFSAKTPGVAGNSLRVVFVAPAGNNVLSASQLGSVITVLLATVTPSTLQDVVDLTELTDLVTVSLASTATGSDNALAGEEYLSGGDDLIASIDASDVGLSSIPGFLRALTSDTRRIKPNVVGVEDLAYQLADICAEISRAGNECVGVMRSMNPIEFRHLRKLTLGDGSIIGEGRGPGESLITGLTSDQTWYLAGNRDNDVIDDLDLALTSQIGVPASLSGFVGGLTLTANLSGVAGNNIRAVAIKGATAATSVIFDAVTRVLTVTLGVDVSDIISATESDVKTAIDAEVAFLITTDVTLGSETILAANLVEGGRLLSGGTDTKGLTNKDVLESIESIAYFVDPATNKNVSDIFLEDSQPIFSDELGAGVSHKDVVAWSLAFGQPTRADSAAWVEFLLAYGNNAYDGVASYTSLDGVSSSDGSVADNFKLFATSNHEIPSSETDPRVLLDLQGNPQDIGHHLDLRAASSKFPADSINSRSLSPSSIKEFTFGAGLGQTVGWYSILASNVATTRKQVLTMTKLVDLGARARSDLVRQRYQVFFDDDGTYRNGRDITLAKFISDEVRSNRVNRFTNRVIKDMLDVAADRGKSSIGQTDTPFRRVGIKQSLEQEFSRWSNLENDGRLQAPATIEVQSEVAGELIISMAASIANEILKVNLQLTIQ